MEELTSALEGSFQVTNAPNSLYSTHPRFGLYKCRGKVDVTQEDRRNKVLQLQKQKRFDGTSHVRRLADNIWEDVDEEDKEQEENMDASMDIDCARARPGRHYKDQLMLSEWMLEVPERFAEDWLMILCPVGKRNLVIASHGQTCSYSRSGYLINSFSSHLPGGSRQQDHWQNGKQRSSRVRIRAHIRTNLSEQRPLRPNIQSLEGKVSHPNVVCHNRHYLATTILDCVYCETSRKFYILDLMCWKQQPIYDSEAEFRFYWLKTKLDELPEISKTSKLNPYSFEVLLNYSCTNEIISKVISTDLPYVLDGLLFYHKHATYTFGTTPLVVWLKSYMLPEILGITIPQHFTTTAPASYQNFDEHATKVRQNLVARERRRCGAAAEQGGDVGQGEEGRRGRGRYRSGMGRDEEGVKGEMEAVDREDDETNDIDVVVDDNDSVSVTNSRSESTTA